MLTSGASSWLNNRENKDTAVKPILQYAAYQKDLNDAVAQVIIGTMPYYKVSIALFR
tara:strand:- start:621 stop:791 length:171 start_codon:yes stop_codon:yes gene_type:complete